MKKRGNKETIIIAISFILIIIGLAELTLNKFFCSKLCPACESSQFGSCFFLFIFTAIIFIVDGASLYVSHKVLKKRK